MSRRPKPGPLLLGRRPVAIADLVDVVLLGRVPELHGAAVEHMAASAAALAAASAGAPPPRELVAGPPMPPSFARATTLARAQGLAIACAGVRPEVVETLCALLVADAVPELPLPTPGAWWAPLLALADAADLEPHERAAFVTGSAFPAGVGALGLARALAARDAHAAALSATVRTLGCDTGPLDAVVWRSRPHGGVREAIEQLAAMPGPGAPAPEGVRVGPQRLGAAGAALAAARDVVEIELLSSGDALLVTPGSGARLVVTGNDDPLPLALALTAAADALHGLIAASAARLAALGVDAPPEATPAPARPHLLDTGDGLLGAAADAAAAAAIDLHELAGVALRVGAAELRAAGEPVEVAALEAAALA